MCKEIKNVLRFCGEFRFFSTEKHVHMSTFVMFLISLLSYQLVLIDLVSPLPRSISGYIYLPIAIDQLTGWVDAYP